MNSKSLFRKAQRYIPSGVNSPVRAFGAVGGEPVFIKKGKGAFLYSADGKRYLDYCLSWGPLILGHAPRGLVKSIQTAVRFGTSFGVSTEREVEVAKKISEALPSIEKVRLVSSGTEAVMSAIRLARGVTGRKKILKIEGGYHGHVDSLLVKAGSGAATFGLPDSLGIPEELAKLTITIPFNDLDSLSRVFKKEGRNLAAFILEPVPANMGVVLPQPGYLETVRSVTKKNGTLLILDEIITGFRLAFGGAQEKFGIDADLTCLGKVLGAGLPLAAFGGKSKYMNELAPAGGVYQAGTLSGNPLATAASLWMMNSLSKGNPYRDLEKSAESFYEEIEDRIGYYGWPLQLNSTGSMFTLFFTPHSVVDFQSAKKSDTRRFTQFFRAVLSRGIYLAPSQFEANFLSTAHSARDLHRTVRIFERVLGRIF